MSVTAVGLCDTRGVPDKPIFIDLERPAGMLDPIRVEPGALLVFAVPAGAGKAMAPSVRQILQSIADAGVAGVTAVVMPDTISVSALSEETMRSFGWVRAGGPPQS